MSWLTGINLNSMEALLIDQLQDLYDAEQQLVNALPNMIEAANDRGLKMALESHFRETQMHVLRLERAFAGLKCPAEAKTCNAMKGLIAEGQETIDVDGEPSIKDAALIAAAQRIEHYEIAAYGSARTFARRMGRGGIAQLLEQTLGEEKNADQTLTRIAESGINQDAATTQAAKNLLTPKGERPRRPHPVPTSLR